MAISGGFVMAERLTTEQLRQLVVNKANQYGVNPSIALVQIARESANFRPDVVYGPFIGGAGERGMSQFTPGTWARFGSGPHTNAYIPEMAMDAWGNYMVHLLGLFSGDYYKALVGYNGGEGHLTNPERYGPPSAAAQVYGREIYAQAGFTADSVVNLNDPVMVEAMPDWIKWAGLGLVAVIVWTALSD